MQSAGAGEALLAAGQPAEATRLQGELKRNPDNGGRCRTDGVAERQHKETEAREVAQLQPAGTRDIKLSPPVFERD